MSFFFTFLRFVSLVPPSICPDDFRIQQIVAVCRGSYLVVEIILFEKEGGGTAQVDFGNMCTLAGWADKDMAALVRKVEVQFREELDYEKELKNCRYSHGLGLTPSCQFCLLSILVKPLLTIASKKSRKRNISRD